MSDEYMSDDEIIERTGDIKAALERVMALLNERTLIAKKACEDSPEDASKSKEFLDRAQEMYYFARLVKLAADAGRDLLENDPSFKIEKKITN